MATATAIAPSREDFAAMLEESFTQGSPQEGTVVKGKIVGIEKDLAVIDVGAKTEGRVAVREFAAPGRQADIKARDDRDMNRAAAPLKQAADAHLLDTTEMDISTAIRAAIDLVEATRAGRGRG